MKKSLIALVVLIVIAACTSSFFYGVHTSKNVGPKTEHVAKKKSHGKSHRYIRTYHKTVHASKKHVASKLRKGDRIVLRGVRYIVR